MKPAAARALEFLLGAAPGAAAGAATGAATYEPSEEQFWRDHTGQVQGRNLTRPEVRERIGRMLRGAALGAALGGTAAVGGGRGREVMARRADLADAKVLSRMFGLGKPEVAAGVTHVPSQHLVDAIEAARASRARHVFGGQSAMVDRQTRRVLGPHPDNTARGQFYRRQGMSKQAGAAKMALKLLKPLAKPKTPSFKVKMKPPTLPKASVGSFGTTKIKAPKPPKLVSSSPSGALAKVKT